MLKFSCELLVSLHGWDLPTGVVYPKQSLALARAVESDCTGEIVAKKA